MIVVYNLLVCMTAMQRRLGRGRCTFVMSELQSIQEWWEGEVVGISFCSSSTGKRAHSFDWVSQRAASAFIIVDAVELGV